MCGLAYAVAALLQSEIMILDEVLAVGDEHFRDKTQSHIRQATSAGKTILFVSHNGKAVGQICDRGIILDRGRMVFEGSAREVIAEYQSRQYVVLQQTKPVKGNGGAEEGPLRRGASDSERMTPKRHFEPRSFVDISNVPRLRQPGITQPTGVLKWVSIHDLDGGPCREIHNV